MATIILRKKKVKKLPPKKHEPITIVVMASSVDGDDRCERCGDYFDGLGDYDGLLVCCGCSDELDEEKLERGEEPNGIPWSIWERMHDNNGKWRPEWVAEYRDSLMRDEKPAGLPRSVWHHMKSNNMPTGSS